MTRTAVPVMLLAAALLIPAPGQATDAPLCKNPPPRVGKLRAKNTKCKTARTVSRRYVDYCPLRADCNLQINYKYWECEHGARVVCALGKKRVSFIDKR